MSNSTSLSLLLLSTIVLVAILIFINKSKSRKLLVKYFNYVIALMITWNLGLILQLLFSEKLNINPIYFDYITYFGIVFLPIALLMTTKNFLDPKFKFQKKHLLLFIVPITSLTMLYTNDFHHLFYVRYSTILSEIIYGPFLYLHLIYTYTLILLSLSMLLKHSIKTTGTFSNQSLLFLLAICIPVIVNVVGMLNIIPTNIYITPISFALSILLITIAIFKYNFLNINTIATQLIVDTISDGYVVIDTENNIISCNKAFLEIFNMSKEKLINSNIFSIRLQDKNFNDDLKVAIDLAKTQSKKITVDKHFEKLDRYFSIDFSPITKSNSYIGTLIFLKDVTQKERDKQKIQRNQDLLVEQERLASLGQMIGGIAHNLKTPIFSIAGGLEGLSDLTKEFDESIDDPNVTSQDMHDIAKDMKDWIVKLKEHVSYMSDVITTVKGQTVTMSESQNMKFSVKELFDHIWILMQHELKEKLTTLSISNNVPYNASIYGNINSLVQVIDNLISNAIEAYEMTNKERKINLSANYDEASQKIIISVQDFGPGLPKEVKEKIFKEMVTTKGKYGTGLGLFMSYSNIKAHFNGELSFESESGKGTTFIISLPSK